MAPITLIDTVLLNQASALARASARGRRNLNFHGDDAERCHRLLNAVEPGSYVAPHRHLDPGKSETITVLRGRFGVVIFSDAGEVLQRACLTADGPVLGINIEAGTWHTLLALEPGSVFLEAKAGPFLPLHETERAPWAPREGEAGVAAFLDRMQGLFPPPLATQNPE